jgi:hypothetical protein
MIGRVATGEIEDTGADPTKAHHSWLQKGGAARAAALSPEQRSEIAKKAAGKRCAKDQFGWAVRVSVLS